ncbi:MAG: hypothetical protein GWN11_12720 [Candidatus Dadabacteria bacterium]|nr:hypothetical protein [Candidatus Dadabacteria bacterium]NIX16699.1 hypothetical protein [Candidatus Dadabacteria bacterium]
MKLDKLINTIEKLVDKADKQTYFDKKELYFEINAPETRFSISTKEDGTLCTTIHVTDSIFYKFYTERDGTLLLEKGSTPDLIENFGLNYIFNLFDNAASGMLEIGLREIESNDYIFRHILRDGKKPTAEEKRSLH